MKPRLIQNALITGEPGNDNGICKVQEARVNNFTGAEGEATAPFSVPNTASKLILGFVLSYAERALKKMEVKDERFRWSYIVIRFVLPTINVCEPSFLDFLKAGQAFGLCFNAN